MSAMNKHGNSKYSPKYAKYLRNGLRAEGKTIAEVCRDWKITKVTYNKWVESFPVFKHAHEMGELDYESFWAERYRNTATGVEEGNAQMLNLVAKNYLGMVDKQEIHTTKEERITMLKIEVLPSNRVPVIIEQEKELIEYDREEDITNTEST